MSAQMLPEEIDLPGRAHDIRGEVFGSLTALRPVGNGQLGVLWLCECACGRYALRHKAALRRAANNEQESQCLECIRELHRGRLQDNSEFLKEIHLLHWHKYGNLYTHNQLKKIERDITQKLRDLEFPVGEPQPDTIDGHGHDQQEPYGTVCDGNEHILSEIGEFYGVSSERARQMCLGAMSKLLHKHRRLLVSLLTGEFDWRVAAIEEVCAEPEFTGCRCASYANSAPGYIYCRKCGQVWKVDESRSVRILTEVMLQRAVIIKDEET